MPGEQPPENTPQEGRGRGGVGQSGPRTEVFTFLAPSGLGEGFLHPRALETRAFHGAGSEAASSWHLGPAGAPHRSGVGG